MRLSVALVGFFIAGCSSTPTLIEVPVLVEVTVYETVPVPEALLQPCRVSLDQLETNQDLERALGEAILELRQCTADKVAISELE